MLEIANACVLTCVLATFLIPDNAFSNRNRMRFGLFFESLRFALREFEQLRCALSRGRKRWGCFCFSFQHLAFGTAGNIGTKIKRRYCICFLN